MGVFIVGEPTRIIASIKAARVALAHERAANLKSDKNCYPVRTSPSANVYEPKVIVRKRREHIPSNDANGIGTLPFTGETSGAGTFAGSSKAHDTLRNSSLMQDTPIGPASVPSAPHNRLLSATEISTGIESDTLDRLQVVEREMWKAFKGEVAGENRPSARVRILREISEVQLRQVSVAKHVQRVERAVPVEWERIRDKVLGALGEYPEALAAVMAALEQDE